MYATELFTIRLEEAISLNMHSDLLHFLPDSHSSIPRVQESLLYICASGERTLPPASEYAFEDVEGFLLLYTVSGTGRIDVTGDHRELKPGSVLMWDCRDSIRIRSNDDDWKIYMIFFDGESANSYYEQICIERFPAFEAEDAPFSDYTFKELLSLGTITSPHKALIANRVLVDMLTDLIISINADADKKRKLPEYITSIKLLFDKKYNDFYSMEELAQRFNVNRYRLSREFSGFFGKTPLKYLNDVRLTHSRTLIETTELSITEIGHRVGIDNSTHFINLFKSKYGLTPNAFRENYKRLTKTQ